MESLLKTEPAPQGKLTSSVHPVDVAQPSEFHLISVLESDEATLEQLPIGPLPEGLLRRYTLQARLRADTELLEDGRWYAEVPMLPGVWADGETETATLQTLEEVIDGWLRLKIEKRDRDIPKLEGIDLNVL